MRRPRADREEKRVIHGKDNRREEQLDPDNPNQRGLSLVVRWDSPAFVACPLGDRVAARPPLKSSNIVGTSILRLIGAVLLEANDEWQI
jgi:hypothetical protein